MAKPYRDMRAAAGTLHVSVLDESGRNIFLAEERWPTATAACRAGCSATMPDGAWRCLRRTPNSYRRSARSRTSPMPPDLGLQQPRVAVRRAGEQRGNRRARASPWPAPTRIPTSRRGGATPACCTASSGSCDRRRVDGNDLPAATRCRAATSSWLPALDCFEARCALRGYRPAIASAALRGGETWRRWKDFQSYVSAARVRLVLGNGVTTPVDSYLRRHRPPARRGRASEGTVRGPTSAWSAAGLPGCSNGTCTFAESGIVSCCSRRERIGFGASAGQERNSSSANGLRGGETSSATSAAEGPGAVRHDLRGPRPGARRVRAPRHRPAELVQGPAARADQAAPVRRAQGWQQTLAGLRLRGQMRFMERDEVSPSSPRRATSAAVFDSNSGPLPSLNYVLGLAARGVGGAPAFEWQRALPPSSTAGTSPVRTAAGEVRARHVRTLRQPSTSGAGTGTQAQDHGGRHLHRRDCAAGRGARRRAHPHNMAVTDVNLGARLLPLSRITPACSRSRELLRPRPLGTRRRRRAHACWPCSRSCGRPRWSTRVAATWTSRLNRRASFGRLAPDVYFRAGVLRTRSWC